MLWGFFGLDLYVHYNIADPFPIATISLGMTFAGAVTGTLVSFAFWGYELLALNVSLKNLKKQLEIVKE